MLLTKGLNALKPLREIPQSPDSVAAYHGGLSSHRPGFKSRPGRFFFPLFFKNHSIKSALICEICGFTSEILSTDYADFHRGEKTQNILL